MATQQTAADESKKLTDAEKKEKRYLKHESLMDMHRMFSGVLNEFAATGKSKSEVVAEAFGLLDTMFNTSLRQLETEAEEDERTENSFIEEGATEATPAMHAMGLKQKSQQQQAVDDFYGPLEAELTAKRMVPDRTKKL